MESDTDEPAAGRALAVVQARRDDQTGFLVSKRLGPGLGLPRPLCALLDRVLRLGCSGPVSAAVDEQRGSLFFGIPNKERELPRQGLSDWRMEARVEGGTVKVTLSAVLFSGESPVPYRPGPVPQYWSDDKQTAPRLTATFEVDQITRLICFGAYSARVKTSTSDPAIGRRGLPPPGRMNLAAALFATGGGIFAVGPPDLWVAVSSGSINGPQLTFTHVRHLRRNDAGLVWSDGQIFPRVWLNGLDMSTVAGLIRRRSKARILLEDGNFGILDDPSQDRQDYEAGINVDRSIEQAVLDFELDERGLHCSYRVFCRSWRTPGAEPGWFEGACTLGWEILIIRFPEIATQWRRRLLDLPDDEGLRTR